ncbi:hypothetical protein ACH4JS_35030 [Streptomyces sp. NPDC017638]|uniref:hypothetical protein n=1 Tax=Streptomyces sp. NPDC017638 TaxID=3365004 RepID=UPI0037B19454
MTGLELREQASVTGSTERVIPRGTARLHGIPFSEDLFIRFADALGTAHVRRAAEPRERGHALAGAAVVRAAELRDAGADVVLSGLADTEQALAAIRT